ncbi:MAG: murein L,D-transpeptidase, partial [Xanthobacteraceae bacterium]
MSGIRLDRLLTSTAILLVLMAAAGGALADPATPDTTVTTPAPGNTSAAAPSDTTQQPDQSTTGSTSPAAAVPAPAAPAPAASTPAAPAAAEAPVAAPATIVAASPDAPIADQLHNLTSGKFDQIIGNKQVRTQIDAFYSGRNYAPIWLTNGKANDRAASAIAYLGHVDADGLDPADYPVPNFAAISDPAALANAEIQLTTSVLTYAHHAAVGRVHWSRVSP